MKFINKQPVFEAEQFDNSEASVKALHLLIGRHRVESWQLTQPTTGDARIVFKQYNDNEIKVLEGQWLVCDADGALSVLDDTDFHNKFDKLPPTQDLVPNLSIGGHRAFGGIIKMSSGGHINGFGYEDKGA